MGEIFSFLNTDNFGGSANNLDASSSLSNPVLVPGHDSTNLFDVSQQLDMSSFPSSGPDFDIAPTFPLDSSVNEHSKFLSDHGDNYPHQMSSTRYQPKDLKGKGNAIENEESREDVQVTVPKVVQETINHTKEKSPKLPPPHRERSQSFNFVPTVFYSVTNSGTKADKTSPDNVIVASSTKHMPASSESQRALPTSTSAKTRSRSMSSLMLHSSFSLSRSSQADINDESTTGIVLYSGSTPEPDPFGAHANTYYTPQTMIPPTPPLKHARKTSKEENQIISSQTQLTPQTELCHLCGRCEVALKSRDELIGILNKKLADVEKDDTKRKNALRSWKKKVQELERVCRQLEETVEESRQESLGRSVIDEASNEALRMLHRQIASLHREKNEWLNREQGLREEVRTLESLVEGRKGMGWEQTAALEKQNADLKAERDALRADVEELEARTSAMAVERNKSEKKGNELTTELQEMWNLKDALEKERDEASLDFFQF